MASTQRKILAFDGGPSPVVSIRIIQKMEEQFPGFLEQVDLFAGTSYGGILSLKLATVLSNKVSATDAIKECIKFADEFLGLFKMTPTRLIRMVSGVLPVISSEGMLAFLQKHFTGPDGKLLRMRDLEKPVTVSAFDSNIGKLRTFHGFEPFSDNVTLLSAALACSSVPIFMPFLKPAGDAAPIVDGGFGANSGAMPALSDALRNMGHVNPDARTGDFLPHITLLSMGCQTTDHPVRIPLIAPLLDLAEKLRLFGREQDVPDGAKLRSVGWFFLVRNNVKVALSLLENTQTLDLHYASNLLDYRRYHRMAPELEALDFLWLMTTNTKAAIRKADALAEEYWDAQMKRYAYWKVGPRTKSSPVFRGDNDLACWLDWYWAQEQERATTASHPPINLRWAQPEVELRSGRMDPRKQLATFDVSAHPELQQRELVALGTCQFIQDARNVSIVGPLGAGKSHLAQGLGKEAMSRGYGILYMPVAKMLKQLAAARAAGVYNQVLTALAGVDLLILEDLGPEPMKDSGPGDFYDVVSARAGKKALLVTSSLPPAKWAGLFGDLRLADAIMTRLRMGSHELILTSARAAKEDERKMVSAHSG